MDHYRKLLMKERPKYKESAQTLIHIEGEEINIGIKNMEMVIISFKSGKICRPEDICAELLKDGTEKLY